MRRGRWVCCVACVGLVALPGCTTDAERDDRQAGGDALARLRSLPYLESSAVSPDAASGVVLSENERVAPGYRLYTIQHLGRADLIAIDGEVVRTWQLQPGDRWERIELLPNGDLLVVGMEGHGWRGEAREGGGIRDSSRYLARLDWYGELVWNAKTSRSP